MEEDIKKIAKENFHNYNKKIPSYLNIMKRNGFTLINREYDKTNNNKNYCIYTWEKNNIRHRSIFKTGGDFYGYSIEKNEERYKNFDYVDFLNIITYDLYKIKIDKVKNLEDHSKKFNPKYQWRDEKRAVTEQLRKNSDLIIR